MNHQPFESWLLSEEALDDEQNQLLREHLASCDQCTSLEESWNQVYQLFEQTPQVTPAAGFTTRFQERLVENNRIRHMGHSWILFAGIAGCAAVLFVLILISAMPILRSPENLVLFIIYRLATLVTYAYTAQNLLYSLFGAITNLIPLSVWIGLFGTFSMVCVLWFVLLKQLSFSRRINL